MAKLSYYAGGKLVNFQAGTMSNIFAGAPPALAAFGHAGAHLAAGAPTPTVGTTPSGALKQAIVANAVNALRTTYGSVSKRFHEVSESKLLFEVSKTQETVTFATATIIVNEAKQAELTWLKKTYGAEVIEEGSHGTVLLSVPDTNGSGFRRAFDISREAVEKGKVRSVHPNFVRARTHRLIQTTPTTAGAGALAATLPWNLDNTGSVGVKGADVKAPGAWAITKGVDKIRVAVLDEGVDTKHPSLKPAVVAEKDFVDGKATAMPDRDDAHGTACAGIILSRNSQFPGLAPKVSLVAARIAKSDVINPKVWIFDDKKTADAIDWCWDDAAADVLSNSWGGGLPSDAISRAFERARTLGRKGKGCVIVVAAGNHQAAVHYPGTLPNVLTVGASNEWDERKTTTSRDGETWWGSNFGDELDLMAPGVHIQTTDINGARGYSPDGFTATFNGTSSSCPHVAAAAALILSVAPALKEVDVRAILTSTCDPMSGLKKHVGSGRLNAEKAVLAAQQTLTAGLARPSARKAAAKKKAAPAKKKTVAAAAKKSTAKAAKKSVKSVPAKKRR